MLYKLSHDKLYTCIFIMLKKSCVPHKHIKNLVRKTHNFILNPQINSLQDSGEINVHMKFEMKINKTFRDRQHPSALDQWTNSPFIGQQVGNCKSFTLTHYLADLFAMHRGPRPIPLCIQHHIQLTSLSFQVSQTSHSWVTAISIFYLEDPRSRSWVRSKFEVTMWV